MLSEFTYISVLHKLDVNLILCIEYDLGPTEIGTKSGRLAMDISANEGTDSAESKDNTSSDKRLRVQITEEDLVRCFMSSLLLPFL